MAFTSTPRTGYCATPISFGSTSRCLRARTPKTESVLRLVEMHVPLWKGNTDAGSIERLLYPLSHLMGGWRRPPQGLVGLESQIVERLTYHSNNRSGD